MTLLSPRCIIAAFSQSPYAHMSRVDEAAIYPPSPPVAQLAHVHTCIHMHAFTCARTLVSYVPQVNSAIYMARDDQLRVTRYWRDATDTVVRIVTAIITRIRTVATIIRTNRVQYLAGVHLSHFNVSRLVDGDQSIADNRDTEVCAPCTWCAPDCKDNLP